MLMLYAPIYRNTPTEALEIIYNHTPPYIEILKVGLSTHCGIYRSLPVLWDGIGKTKDKYSGFS